MPRERFVSMCIPGDEARGDEPTWYVFDLEQRKSVSRAGSREQAQCAAADLNHNGKNMQKPVACILTPRVEPHTDPSRVIGFRTTYHGTEHRYLRDHDVVIVAVLKHALCTEEHDYLATEEEIVAAGGVGPDDRIEVSPILPEEGRLSFVTSDPRAIDLACFAALARRGADPEQPGGQTKKGKEA